MEIKLKPVIGLEIHVQLKTKSKMFCGCDNKGEDAPPNTTICPICTGQPGTLPAINEKALEWGILAGLALNGRIAEFTKFDRKNYFYPDLPKGYQISQYDIPLVKGGWLEIDLPALLLDKGETKEGVAKTIHLTRLHLEEDAAKSIHSKDGTLIDFNRCGTPLLEIVTEPEMASPQEAKIFLQELRLICRYLGISEAEMEKGHLRCDANISLQSVSNKNESVPNNKLHPKTEIKNLNSFKAVERALEYEIKRQTELWQKGTPPDFQSTRGWDEKKETTVEQRGKEESQDYRYFPEPDLPPLKIEPEWVEIIGRRLTELPRPKRQRFMSEYGLDSSDAKILTEDGELADYLEKAISELRGWISSLEETEGTDEEIWEKNKQKLIRLTGNWLVNRLLKLTGESGTAIKNLKISPENFAEFITLIYRNKINSQAAQIVLKKMFASGADPSHVIEEEGLAQVSDESDLESIVKKILDDNPGPAADYKKGKENVIMFLLGQAMKETKGRANPDVVKKILKEKLSS